MIEPRPAIQRLYRTPAGPERHWRLRLHKNENLIGCGDDLVREALANLTARDLAAYPNPWPLMEKIAERYGVEIGSVLLAAGSELVIRYVFETFLVASSSVVCLEPSFAMFRVYADLNEARFIPVACGLASLPASAVLDAVDHSTRIIAIANPNSPTGTVIARGELLAIVEAAAESNIVVLIDEAYYYFHGETLVGDVLRFPNLVVTRTFSKAVGLAGIRLGFAIAAPSLIAAVRKVTPIDPVNTIALRLGDVLLTREDRIWQYGRDVADGKLTMRQAAAALGIGCPESAGNFVLLQLGPHKQRVISELQAQGIAVSGEPGLADNDGYVRLTVGPPAVMAPVIDVLKRVFSAAETS